MIGHSNGINDNYYKVTEQELLDEYLKAVDSLTISKEHHLLKTVSSLQEQNTDRYEELSIRLELKNKEIQHIRNEQYIITSQFKVLLSSFNTLDKQTKVRLAKEWIQLGVFEVTTDQVVQE